MAAAPGVAATLGSVSAALVAVAAFLIWKASPFTVAVVVAPRVTEAAVSWVPPAGSVTVMTFWAVVVPRSTLKVTAAEAVPSAAVAVTEYEPEAGAVHVAVQDMFVASGVAVMAIGAVNDEALVESEEEVLVLVVSDSEVEIDEVVPVDVEVLVVLVVVEVVDALTTLKVRPVAASDVVAFRTTEAEVSWAPATGSVTVTTFWAEGGAVVPSSTTKVTAVERTPSEPLAVTV